MELVDDPSTTSREHSQSERIHSTSENTGSGGASRGEETSNESSIWDRGRGEGGACPPVEADPLRISDPKCNSVPFLLVKRDPSPYTQTPHFRIDHAPGAGLGAFATRDLPPGTVILREPAMLIATRKTLPQVFARLGEEERRVIGGLAIGVGDGLRGIFDTNAYAIPRRYVHLPFSPDATATVTRECPLASEEGLFPVASRLNHACGDARNVCFHFDTEVGCLVMKVADFWRDGAKRERRDGVREGEELRVTYRRDLDPLGLHARYGFKCECGGCEGYAAAEEEQWNAMPW